MWRLDYPAFSLLLVLVPVFVYFTHFRRARGGKISFSFGIWGEKAFKTKGGLKKTLIFFSRFLFWFGFSALIIALCGPVTISKQRNYLTRGVDMIIILDQSPSMSARDTGKVSRFEAAKEVIKGFIEGRENDLIGLVTFGKEAALRVPPTLDYAALGEALDKLRIMELGDGTAIGSGIAVAALHLNAAEVAGDRVIILLTDGDNNAGEIRPEQAALIASRLGIRLYTIGIGREGETELEFTDPKTGKQYRGIYKGKFNETLLKKLSFLSGGSYFQAAGLGTLQAVFKEIDTLEKSEKRMSLITRRTPKQKPFILFGLLLILADLTLRKIFLRELL